MQKAFVLLNSVDTRLRCRKRASIFATVQVRNKVVQAYNDIMNMQV